MKKVHFLLVLLLCLSSFSFSQMDERQVRPRAARNIKALKTAFVARQLALTPEEAQKFWPVYYNYTTELKAARQGQHDDVIALEENVLNLRKKYRGELKKILVSDERVNKALTVDRDFMNVVRRELQQRVDARKQPGAGGPQ